LGRSERLAPHHLLVLYTIFRLRFFKEPAKLLFQLVHNFLLIYCDVGSLQSGNLFPDELGVRVYLAIDNEVVLENSDVLEEIV